MISWEVQGSSRGGPGARGGPSGAPGHDFGPPRASFWVPFWSIFWYNFTLFSEAISASFLDAVLVPFGVQFWVVLEALWELNFVIKSLTFQSTFPGDPGHRHSAKTSKNAGSVV